jgi:O-antigen ligase
LRFAAAKEGVKFVAPSGRLVDLPAVPKVEVAGLEGALSGRLFIWSRTLPLLTETVFFGRGPGTFALYFPQHDYVGKLLAAGDMARLYDKPHNLYLEIAFSTGLLSLACFLFLVLLYLKEGLRLYRQGNADLLAATGSGVLAAVASYLVTALANDGFVTVAPVFWVLLGLGTAVNRMARLRQ